MILKKLGFSLRKTRSLDLPPSNVIRNSFEATEVNTIEGISLTRMHSSKMRTVRFSCRLGGGGGLPRGICPQPIVFWDTTPPVNRMTDRCKNHPAGTSVISSKLRWNFSSISKDGSDVHRFSNRKWVSSMCFDGNL